MRLASFLTAVLLIFISPGGATAEQEVAQLQRMPVVLRHAGSDLVGLALSVALKEELAAAPFLDFQAGDPANPRVLVIVATVDGSVEEPGKQTAASVGVLYDADTLPANGYLITSMVQVCGITRTYECAREIVGFVGTALEQLRKNNPDLWSTLQVR